MTAGNLALSDDESLLVGSLRGMSWTSLLVYFQSRTKVNYFPLPTGAAKHEKNAQRILANEFSFNNETYCLAGQFDWKNNPSKDLEWLILLHKFYYLKDLSRAYDFNQDEVYATKWIELIDSWISQVSDELIDSQVAGRRLQQWILSYHYFVTKWQSSTVTPQFFERFLHSINSQTHFVCRHLTAEGNHRTLELYAIFLVAVTFPELNSAACFLNFSKHKLIENIRNDLLPDGVHRELSTDYHHTVLKNYLRFWELAALNQIELPSDCEKLLKKAIEFSYYVHKPDGYIPAINDGDCNTYLPLLKKANACFPSQYLQFVLSQGEEGTPPVERSKGFTSSGYYVLRSDWTTQPYSEALYLFFDCAPVGFGSHGHYDAMNVEIAAYGHSLIVDPGRYTYSEESEDGINWRQLFKGTAAHNTVVVDGLDQLPYQPGRPASPEYETSLKQFVSGNGFDFLHGQIVSHQYPVIHDRMIYFKHPEYWIVTDLLTAEDQHDYDLYFHLSDRAQGQTSLETINDCLIVYSPGLLIAQPDSANTKAVINQGYVSPEYGIKHEAPVIHFSRQHASSTVFQTVIYPFKDSQPQLQVKGLPLYHQGRFSNPKQASVLSIHLKTEAGKFNDYFFINHGSSQAEYQFAGIRCACGLLYLRKNEAGQIINLQAEDVDFIQDNEESLIIGLNGFGRISYQDQSLSLTDLSIKKEMAWTGLAFFPKWDDLLSRWDCE